MASYSSNNRPTLLATADTVVICEAKHTVRFTKGYYLDTEGNRFNEFAFQKLGLDPREVAAKVYGYDNGGSWPFAHTLADLTNADIRTWFEEKRKELKRKPINERSKSSSYEFPLNDKNNWSKITDLSQALRNSNFIDSTAPEFT